MPTAARGRSAWRAIPCRRVEGRIDPEARAGAALGRPPLGLWLESLRPDQWTKNVLVFAALVFGMRLLDPAAVVATAVAFVVFCAAGSAAYLLNDIVDLERDRAHPLKRARPIASGAISVPRAALGSAALALSALTAAAWVSAALAGVVAVYLALNVAYSLALKHVVLVDVMTISLGFVLRAVAGGAAIGVQISPWLVLCTFMLMLFLALGKRRAELHALDGAEVHRPVMRGYRVELLDQLITIVVAATILTYCMYTLSPEVRERFGVEHLETTVPFVVYGLFRYLWLVRTSDRPQNPTRAVATDRPILAAGALWGLLVVWLLYVAG
jgi:4-hydroxybenzoate polyprenyltransferase